MSKFGAKKDWKTIGDRIASGKPLWKGDKGGPKIAAGKPLLTRKPRKK